MIRTRDVRIINKLLGISRELDNGMRCRHVSALYKGKKLVSLAHNISKTHPYEYKWSRSQNKQWLHAEKACILQAKWRGDLSSTTLYVVRADLNGEQSMSRPCQSCLECIQEEGIPRVVYTINGGIMEEHI